jgi:two-component system, NtrC family, nitrogen regulation response regulator NtrX
MSVFILVDGDRNFRRGLEIALRLDGVEVLSAGSVSEALRLLDAGPCDLLVVDSLLPAADALLERAAAEGLRAVATGPHRELLDRAARLHAVPTIEKPFGAADLLAVCAATRDGAAA